MFISTRRPIVIPQSEHLKLAGTLALLWGNAQFKLPPVAPLSLVTGIGLHDRAYGSLDNDPIPGVADERWLAITRRGFFMPCADPIADLITRHHLLRLVSGKDNPAHRALAEEMRQEIHRQTEMNSLDAGMLQRIDRLTNLCDRIAFDFCYERPVTVRGEVEVFTDDTESASQIVHYQIKDGEITLDPWPLNVRQYSGYLVGYQLDGYPEKLESLVIPFSIQPA